MTQAIALRGTAFSHVLERLQEGLENYYWPEKFPMSFTSGGEPCFEKDVRLKNGNKYTLGLHITREYPDGLPDLVVYQSPKPMPSWGGSHVSHTWPTKDGLLRICYYHPWCWTSKNMLYEIFKKGKQWLKAYEKHLVEGKPICDYLTEMIPTKEEEEAAKQREIYALIKFKEQVLMECFSFTINFNNPSSQAMSIFPHEHNNSLPVQNEITSLQVPQNGDVLATVDRAGLLRLFDQVYFAFQCLISDPYITSVSIQPNIIIYVEREQQGIRVLFSRTWLTSLGPYQAQNYQGDRVQNAIVVQGDKFPQLLFSSVCKLCASSLNNTDFNINRQNARIMYTPFVPVLFG